MIPRRFQTLLFGALPLALAACTDAESALAFPTAQSTPLGIDLGRSAGHRVAQLAVATSARPIGTGHKILSPGGARTELIHEGHGGASATGTVNSVDIPGQRVNVSHGAVQALGWPPMTMDFPVSPSVNLNAIKPGAKVNFTLDKGSDGKPMIDTMTPVGGGK